MRAIKSYIPYYYEALVIESAPTDLIIDSALPGVVRLHLDRPAKKNALSTALYRALSTALEAAREDPSVKVVVLSAAGPDFCAGNDILDFVQSQSNSDAMTESGAIDSLPVFQFLKSLTYFPKPLVALVQGKAVGIGTTLLLHCDMVVLADDARLSTPFAKLGLSPEAASSALLPACIGHVRAFEMLSLGDAIGAEQALQFGLANRVCAPSALLETGLTLAQKLSSLSSSSLIQTKALMKDPDVIWSRIEREALVFQNQLMSEEARAAFMAFMSRG